MFKNTVKTISDTLEKEIQTLKDASIEVSETTMINTLKPLRQNVEKVEKYLQEINLLKTELRKIEENNK